MSADGRYKDWQKRNWRSEILRPPDIFVMQGGLPLFLPGSRKPGLRVLGDFVAFRERVDRAFLGLSAKVVKL